MTPGEEALRAHMAGTSTTLCRCWRLSRRDGTAMGFTDHDRKLFFGGTEFEPEAGFGQSEAEAALGLAAARVDIEGALSSDRLQEEDILGGLYDGATVETFLVNWADTAQHMKLRTAVIGTVALRDGRLVAELESPLTHLDRPNGRMLSRGCDAELGDHRCRVDLDGFRAAGTVLAVTAVGTIVVDGLDGFADGWFGHGRLAWTSGALAGREVAIREHRSGIEGRLLVLARDLATPAEGDAFVATAGCDKRFATCRKKFANSLNFRGFPHLPGNDAAYGYATDGQVFDGRPLVE